MTNEDKDNKKNKFIQTFKLICEVGTKKLNLPRASIWLLDSFKNELNCIVYCNNKSKTVEEDLTVEITSDFLKSISNSRLISIKNTSEETTVKKLYEAYFKPLGIKSVLISSIIISGKTLGLLFFEETKPGRAWEEKEKNLALDLANQLASKMTEKNHISYQNKLNISENKYRTIFENVNDVIFILDKLTIIDCNSKAVDCFGISRDKLLNKKITFLFPDKQDDGKTSAEEFEKILEEKQTEKDHFFEWKFKDSQGRVIITEVSLSVISMGKHDYITLIVRDITRRRKNEEELEKHRSKLEKLVRERTRSLQKTNKQLEEEIIKHRKTEEALRTSDRRITMAFEAANEGIWDWDLEKDEFYLSPRFYELLGYKTEEFHADKDSLVKLAHNDDREKFELNLECFKTNEQEYNKFSIRMKYKDGEYRWFTFQGKVVERTGVRPSRVIGTIEDITTQKLQQEQYKQQSQFLKNVIESLAHPFLVIDAENYDVILANSATHQKFKKCGIKCYELTHKIDRPCTDNHEICPLNKIRKIKKPVVIDHVHYDDRGNPRNMEVHAHPIFDENGEVKQIIEYTLDVTERKQAEKLLKRRLEFEKVISNISANFVITKNIYNYISKSLSSLAMIIDAQRINLFKFDKTKNIIENLQQWKKKDILPEKSPLCNVSLNKLPYLKEQIKSKPLISWTDISKLTGKGEAEKKFFQENKIESILVFPILIKGQVSGLLVIENIINPDSLKNEDTVFLKIISEIFASALERHLAENALLNSEIKYRKLYENIRDGIVNIDNRGNIIESNQAFQKMLGYSAETLQKLSIVDIIPKKWYRKERQIIENQVPQKGYSKLHELELIKKDGTVFPVEIQIYLKKTEKEAEGIWASIRDITKRKETEQRLLEMSQFRESVIQNANVWLHVTNKKDEIVLVNKAAQQISGYSKEELLNTEKIWNKLYPDEQYRKKISEVQKKKFENGEYLENFETTITCREGFEKIMLWNLRQLTDENGEALGSITIGRDITERKKAETELQRVIRELTEAKKEAEQANKFKSEFLANMSHEIRTPMNAIIGFSNILQESKLPKELQHYLIHIKNSSEHLLDLINDILDLSKIEAGRLEIEEFEFDLVEVFKKVLSILKPRAKKKKLKVKALIEEDITETFIGDATRIRQILMNLLSNAIKFTEEGRVNVTLTTDHLNRTDDILPIKITVEDTGVGIPEDRLERIFDSFERGTSSTNRAHEGTGLGLSITRKLTELMNGTIDVKSIEGEGTTFTVKIPLKVKKNSHRALPKGRSTKTREIKRYQQFKDKLILVIENDEAYRHLLEMNLKQLVNKVVGVPSAEDAQKFISFLKPDLIILDIVLPGMSGWDFLSQFRTEKGDLLIPTIVYSVVSDEQKCAEFGVKQCINKSVRIESLLPRLEKILSEMYSTKKIVLIEDEQLIINTIRTRLKDYPFELNVFNSSQQGIDFVKNNDVDFVIIDMDLSGENGVKFFSSLAELGKKDIKVFVYTGKELTQSEKNIINYYSETILYKYETSIEQLLEEVNKTKIEKPTKGLQEVNFSNETRVPEKTQKPEVKAFNQSEKEILIVEDNPVNQELIKVYLKKCPYKLTFSKNGLEAVELAQVRKFDVILMDIQLPTIDGYEATRRIRKESKNQETPIIALTAHAMKGEEEKARSAGCNSYLSKPVDKEKLIKTISSFTQIETEISLKEELLGRIDPDIVELLPHYIENVKETIRGMKKSLASQNYGSLRRKAHNLKGTGSSFGLNKISLLGEKLEIAVDRNDIEEARNLVKNLEEYYIGLSNEFSPDK